MAERFERLYKLLENLYIDGSPIIISAGALLKDTATGSVVAQLKFHSVTQNIIKAIKVSICAYDVSGSKIEGVNDYQYLDLSVRNGQEFGSNKAIVLPQAITRSFYISDITIVFSDDTKWRCEDPAKFKQLPLPKLLSVELHNAELEKQYKLSTTPSAAYVPFETMSIWNCTCGEWNSDSKCTKCGSARQTVFSALDVDTLQIEANKRIATEQAQREEAARIAAEAENKRQEALEIKKSKILRKIKISTFIIIPIIVVLFLFKLWLWPEVMKPSLLYNKVESLIANGEYQEATLLYIGLNNDEKQTSNKTHLLELYYIEANELYSENKLQEASLLFEFLANEDYKDAKNHLENIVFEVIETQHKQTIDAGYDHIIGLKEDGTVVATGSNNSGQCNIDDWSNIIAVSAGGYHTIGLKSDGTVVATGENDHGQCEVSKWENIVAIYAGCYHTVGLTSDGKVIGTGDYYSNFELISDWKKELSSWHNYRYVAAGNNFTVGIKSDYTVTAIGSNEYGQCNTSKWSNIHTLAVSSGHTVGLKSNGTVVATGIDLKNCGQLNVNNWSNIVSISAGSYHTIGAKVDGKVVAVGHNEYGQCNVSDWENIISVTAGSYFSAALKSDGTVVAVGNNEYGQCNVSEWSNIKIPD